MTAAAAGQGQGRAVNPGQTELVDSLGGATMGSLCNEAVLHDYRHLVTMISTRFNSNSQAGQKVQPST